MVLPWFSQSLVATEMTAFRSSTRRTVTLRVSGIVLSARQAIHMSKTRLRKTGSTSTLLADSALLRTSCILSSEITSTMSRDLCCLDPFYSNDVATQ